MKIGTCVRRGNSMFDAPKSAAYLEPAATDIYRYGPWKLHRVKKAIRKGVIYPLSVNVLIDSKLRLTGPDVDFEAIQKYCRRLFARLADLNIRLLVFGSGKAKHVPDGFPMEEAWEQLFKLGHILADEAEKHGQTIVIEPLSYSEVNIINTVEDAVYYAKTLNRDNVKVLVDFYHFDCNGEDFSSLEKNREWIAHAHFASQKTRTAPRSEEDWEFFTRCVKALKEIGYDGALSFEGRVKETDDMEAVLTRMQEIERSLTV